MSSSFSLTVSTMTVCNGCGGFSLGTVAPSGCTGSSVICTVSVLVGEIAATSAWCVIVGWDGAVGYNRSEICCQSSK